MSRQANLFNVLKGLRDRYASDATLVSLLSGGWHAYQPPSDAAYPFVVCTVVDVEPWDSAAAFEHQSGETLIIQMTAFSDAFPDADQILQIGNELTRVFDEAALSIDGYHTVRMERVAAPGPLKNPDSDLYYWPLRYRLMLQKL